MSKQTAGASGFWTEVFGLPWKSGAKPPLPLSNDHADAGGANMLSMQKPDVAGLLFDEILTIMVRII